MSSNINLYIDFGSTFTKVTAIDLENENVIGMAKAVTTADTDISDGLEQAIDNLFEEFGNMEFKDKYASSSASGGLKMVTIGLVPQLTAEASKRAALGAGAKILKVYSYKLTHDDIMQINKLDADVLLICGGTDGGNKDNIIYNSEKITLLNKDIPIIYAGNNEVAYDCRTILERKFSDIRITENVMPELGELNVEPVRKTIREVFLERIIKAKGFAKAQRNLSGILMPTPSAVLNSASLLAKGTHNEPGIGELMVVDPGGATTDVHSIAKGEPTKEGIMLKGLAEPFEKRTVEGDVGLRYTIYSLIETCSMDKIKEDLKLLGDDVLEVEKYIEKIHKDIRYVPSESYEINIDNVICKNAVSVATERHVGNVETIYTPFGATYIQKGKDLTQIEYVIGTGGAIINSNNPKYIMDGVLFNQDNPNILKPINPKYMIDKDYIMYALGLLGETNPDMAVRMLKKYVVSI